MAESEHETGQELRLGTIVVRAGLIDADCDFPLDCLKQMAGILAGFAESQRLTQTGVEDLAAQLTPLSDAEFG